ncbi:MAG: hypothetical protein F6K17_15885 [Okeania sp. SIO3C4]|nr:hypothetical protein [Okeania sp. SIO3C4]
MEHDENLGINSKIDCPHCKKSIEVPVIKIVRSEKIACSNCGKVIELSLFNTENEKNKRKNVKELEKLKKLLPPD